MFARNFVKATRTLKRFNHSVPSYANDPAFGKANAQAGKAFAEHLTAVEHHAAGTAGLWKRISFFIALPAIGLTAINTYFVEVAHAHHREHMSKLTDDEWPVEYEFQNIRSKDYFWGDGDKTLFWNPAINRHVKK